MRRGGGGGICVSAYASSAAVKFLIVSLPSMH